MSELLHPRDLQFLLYELLDVEALTARPRFAEQSREIYDAVLETARAVAEEHYFPNRKRNDQEEPQIVDGVVVTQSDLKPAYAATAEAGIIPPHTTPSGAACSSRTRSPVRRSPGSRRRTSGARAIRCSPPAPRT